MSATNPLEITIAGFTSMNSRDALIFLQSLSGCEQLSETLTLSVNGQTLGHLIANRAEPELHQQYFSLIAEFHDSLGNDFFLQLKNKDDKSVSDIFFENGFTDYFKKFQGDVTSSSMSALKSEVVEYESPDTSYDEIVYEGDERASTVTSSSTAAAPTPPQIRYPILLPQPTPTPVHIPDESKAPRGSSSSAAASSSSSAAASSSSSAASSSSDTTTTEYHKALQVIITTREACFKALGLSDYKAFQQLKNLFNKLEEIQSKDVIDSSILLHTLSTQVSSHNFLQHLLRVSHNHLTISVSIIKLLQCMSEQSGSAQEILTVIAQQDTLDHLHGGHYIAYYLQPQVINHFIDWLVQIKPFVENDVFQSLFNSQYAPDATNSTMLNLLIGKKHYSSIIKLLDNQLILPEKVKFLSTMKNEILQAIAKLPPLEQVRILKPIRDRSSNSYFHQLFHHSTGVLKPSSKRGTLKQAHEILKRAEQVIITEQLYASSASSARASSSSSASSSSLSHPISTKTHLLINKLILSQDLLYYYSKSDEVKSLVTRVFNQLTEAKNNQAIMNVLNESVRGIKLGHVVMRYENEAYTTNYLNLLQQLIIEGTNPCEIIDHLNSTTERTKTTIAYRVLRYQNTTIINKLIDFICQLAVQRPDTIDSIRRLLTTPFYKKNIIDRLINKKEYAALEKLQDLDCLSDIQQAKISSKLEQTKPVPSATAVAPTPSAASPSSSPVGLFFYDPDKASTVSYPSLSPEHGA